MLALLRQGQEKESPLCSMNKYLHSKKEAAMNYEIVLSPINKSSKSKGDNYLLSRYNPIYGLTSYNVTC